MQWLQPMMALYAAAAVLPPLLLLYFLKLRRREQIVSSTFLWQRAVRDLQVNAPFQRLRKNLLLLIQFLILAAIIAALGRPMLALNASSGRRYVLMIDRSASMSSLDEKPSRLELAKKQARTLADSLQTSTGLSLQSKADQAMVIAFDNHAKVMCNFTSDKAQILAAIDSIIPSDSATSLAEALTVARAFAQSPGVDANNRSSETPAQLELFSDGQIRDLAGLSVSSEEMAFHCIGKDRDNLAVTALQARRSYDNAEQAEVFATLSNYGPADVTCDLQLSVNGSVKAVKSATIPAAKIVPGKPLAPGQSSISFTLSQASSGVVEVRHMRSDVLESDDTARVILAPPKQLRALVVSSGNPALTLAMNACPLAKLDTKTPAEFQKMDMQLLAVEQPYDVIVLDNYCDEKLPRCRYLMINTAPAFSGVSFGDGLINQPMVDWRSRHPVLQYVNFSNFFAAKARKMTLPRDAEVLAELPDSPAIALVRKEGSAMLVMNFDPMQTNWPLEPAYVMFFYNAMNYLGMDISRGESNCLQPGQTIRLEGLLPSATVRASTPQGPLQLQADQAGILRFPATERVGLYRFAAENKPPADFAVNILDGRESDVSPARLISFGGQKIAASSGPPAPANIELWPYLALAALVLVLLEWFVYNSRIRL